MNLPYIKFFPRDWTGDSGLQQCSLEARGFWIECICVMAQANRYGYLETSLGIKPSISGIARLVRCDEKKAEEMLAELLASGVVSICKESQTYYSRRMVKDHENYSEACHNGKSGGNPALKNSKTKSNTITITNTTLGLRGGITPPLTPVYDFIKSINDYNDELLQKFQQWVKARMAMKRSKDWEALFMEQARWLERFTHDQRIEILSASIRNGWQGLFEPKPQFIKKEGEYICQLS